MIWKDVVGFEDRYKVSSAGLVYSKHKNQLKATKKNNRGYVQVSLHKDGKEHTYLLHRVVAMAFIPNPNNLPQINHIDEDKENNRVENLEWCTRIENERHGTKHKRCVEHTDYNAIARKNSKPVAQYTLDGKLIKIWESLAAMSAETGYSRGNISMCCNGKYKNMLYGFSWAYV